MKKNNSLSNLPFVLLFLVSALYAIFSYSLTDPNLIISSWSPYWSFQLWMWQTFFNNAQLLSYSFLAIISLFFIVYLIGLNKIHDNVSKDFIFKVILAVSPLFFSYNALSHDVFNYMFNAKMVTLFQADPHIKTALDFYYDDWTRFMHNTHTPAPYGYGWTIFSVFPYLLGFHKFLPTWLIFKLLAWLSYYLLFLALKNFVEKLTNKPLNNHTTWLIFANPLVIIEILSNLHNDFWMLVPAIVSLNLIIKKPKKFVVSTIIISLLLLAFSISTKLATIVLVPFWFYWFVKLFLNQQQLFKIFQPIEKHLPLLISIALFLPLLTSRSQQFLPWYLTWSMIWLVVIKKHDWKNWLLALSFTALLRYLPWLQTGGFEGNVIQNQKLITFGGGLVVFFIIQVVRFFKTKTSTKATH